jgi:putative cell wall-binding protein
MLKKPSSILLAVIILLTSNSNLLYAYADSLISNAKVSSIGSGQCGDNVTWTLENGVLTISGSGDMYNYSYSFGSSTSSAPWSLISNIIKEVKIEDGVTSIGDYAFYNCQNLTKVVIESTVAPTIANYTFSGTKDSLKFIVPKDSTGYDSEIWTSYPIYEKDEDGNLSGNCGEDVTWILHDGVLTILGSGSMYDYIVINDYGFVSSSAPWYLFSDEITEVKIQEEVTSIGNYAFYNCFRLTSITIPDSVTEIGDSAFYCCLSLTNITIPDSVATIGTHAFSTCSNLTSVTISDSVKAIGDYAFAGCTSLRSIKIPASVTSIESWTFVDCSNLTNITISASVTSIGEGAFYGCTSLNKVIMKGSIAPTIIGDLIFEGVDYFLTIVPAGATGYSNWFNVKYMASVPSPTATITSSLNIQLRWGADASAEKFEIYRSDSENGKYTKIATTKLNSYIDTTAVGGKMYYYRVKAINETYPDLNSELSNIVSAKATLDTPVVTGENDYDGHIVISWNNIENASSYEIYRGEDADNIQLLLTTTSTSYLDEATAQGTTYFYKVKAVYDVNQNMNSAYSNVVEITDNTIATGTVALFSEKVNSIRLSGDNRYDTAISTANSLKTSMGVEKFENIVVAYGDDYADALAGSYLAKAKNAPILIVNKSSESKLKEYIDENLASGGTVYLLGGTGVVSADFEKSLSKYNVKRLGGTNRFETNMQILQEAGVTVDDILICSAYGFADSLSASAVGKPILLVGKTLTDEQKTYLASLGKKSYYIIGGTGAVSQNIENELKTYGSVKRVAGANRYETSAEVAKTFFADSSDTVVLAYGLNFPDGLSGGPLAMSLNAPLLLVSSNSTNNASASAYVTAAAVDKAICLGGSALISDTAVKEILGSK